uniref:Uncharacterized protein n=1 Tax=Octactis speculum TaxID=3111310 RepID=A0A7S2AKY5_9STRA
MPAPAVAVRYYEGVVDGDDTDQTRNWFLFDEFQTSRESGSRRVQISNLLNVFESIRDDEAEHVATMKECQDPSVMLEAAKSELVTVGLLAGSLAIPKMAPLAIRFLGIDSVFDGLSEFEAVRAFTEGFPGISSDLIGFEDALGWIFDILEKLPLFF